MMDQSRGIMMAAARGSHVRQNWPPSALPVRGISPLAPAGQYPGQCGHSHDTVMATKTADSTILSTVRGPRKVMAPGSIEVESCFGWICPVKTDRPPMLPRLTTVPRR